MRPLPSLHGSFVHAVVSAGQCCSLAEHELDCTWWTGQIRQLAHPAFRLQSELPNLFGPPCAQECIIPSRGSYTLCSRRQVQVQCLRIGFALNTSAAYFFTCVPVPRGTHDFSMRIDWP